MCSDLLRIDNLLTLHRDPEQPDLKTVKEYFFMSQTLHLSILQYLYKCIFFRVGGLIISSHRLILKFSRTVCGWRIFSLLWNPNFHDSLLKSCPKDYILNQLSTTHILTHYLLSIEYSSILPSVPRTFKWSLSLFFLSV